MVQLIQVALQKDCFLQFILWYLFYCFSVLQKKYHPLEESGKSVRACITVISLPFPILFIYPRFQCVGFHQGFLQLLAITVLEGTSILLDDRGQQEILACLNAVVNMMGPGLDTWARLSSTQKFSMIVSLRPVEERKRRGRRARP